MSNFFCHILSLIDCGFSDGDIIDRLMTDNKEHIDSIWHNPSFPGDCSSLMIQLVRRRNLPLVKKMVELGSEAINIGVGFHPPPLHIAVEGNDLQMTRYILSVCPESRLTQDKMGSYPIFAGVINDNRATVMELLKFPEQIGLLDRYGRTCLHLAVIWQQYVSSAMVEFLLISGIDRNKIDQFGHSAIEYAKIFNNQPAFEVLSA